MKHLKTILVATTMAAALFSAPVAYAAEGINVDGFVKMCDMDKDGMVSKKEAMKMIEKMWDKQDTKKMGKLDKKQVEAFLNELMKSGG
ncbi:MAG: hypothetical protein ABIR98_06845 [Usitatibacter sp.]